VERRGRQVVILPEALERLRSQVVDKALHRRDKARRATFTEQARAYGMKPDAIRQMIHRGPPTPEGTPDWEALDVQFKRNAVKHKRKEAETRAPSEDTISREDLIAACKTRLVEVEPGSEEWAILQDKLRELQQETSPSWTPSASRPCGLSLWRTIRQP
jgi:hypothetical protein